MSLTPMSIDLAEFTWTCHVCRQRRPDPLISVHKHEHPIEGHDGAYAHCNVRYCSDNEGCREKAADVCFMAR